MSNKIATIAIDIPYKRAGNVITQQPVRFDVLQEAGYYKLVPLLNENELLVANLPNELLFRLENGKPVSLRGPRDGNFHVIKDAVAALQGRHQL